MMVNWYTEVSKNISKIPDCIIHFDNELLQAKKECSIWGNLEKASASMPGVVEHRFNQLQEIEAILEHLNIQLRKIRAKHYRKYLENYQRALTSRDAEKYIDGEDEVVNMSQLINEFALVRNKYLGLLKAIDAKQFQIDNIVKLRVAGLDDAELYSKNTR